MRKITATAAIIGTTLVLAACSNGTTEPTTDVQIEQVRGDRTVQAPQAGPPAQPNVKQEIWDLSWSKQSASDRRSMCNGIDLAPAEMYAAFDSAAGGYNISYTQFIEFVTTSCADDA